MDAMSNNAKVVVTILAATVAFVAVIGFGLWIATSLITNGSDYRAAATAVAQSKAEHKADNDAQKTKAAKDNKAAKEAANGPESIAAVAEECGTSDDGESTSQGINDMLHPTTDEKVAVFCLAEAAGVDDQKFAVEIGGEDQTRTFDEFGNQTITKVTKSDDWKATFQVNHDGSGRFLIEHR